MSRGKRRRKEEENRITVPAEPLSFEASDISYYYQHIFPSSQLCKWLTYNGEYSLGNREFSFAHRISRNSDGLMVKRHQYVKSSSELLEKLVINKPTRIDVGAVYNQQPKDPADEKKNEGKEDREEITARELIFDVDLSDYDEVRTCCKEKTLCNKCWKYAAIACRILDASIKEYYEFAKILWVFSGRRGFHAWVCDKRARELSDDDRTDIIKFLNIFKGGLNRRKRIRILTPRPHPLISERYEMCLAFFEKICLQEQNILHRRQDVMNFLEQIPPILRYEVALRFNSSQSSLEKWNIFLEFYKEEMKNPRENPPSYQCLVEEIVMHYTYSRLDVQVTSTKNHLLKCPFSFHPDTGKFALVFFPTQADSFDVEKVPTLEDVVKQHKLSKSNPAVGVGKALRLFREAEKRFEKFLEAIDSED